MANSVCIISNDNLRIIGLKYILNEYFDIDIIKCFQDVLSIKGDYDLYLTDAATFAYKPDFFLHRREKLVVFSDSEGSDFNLSTKMSLTNIIQHLKPIIDHITKQNENRGKLSEREIDVLKLIVKGLLNKEIAETLNISINTVLSHRKNITSKLGIKSVSGLSVYAMMHGYIK